MKILFYNLEKVFFHKFAVISGLLLPLLVGCYRFTIYPLDPPDSISFDNGDQGWQVSEGGIGSYSSIGGNPGGYIVGTDNAPGVWYFISSKNFVNAVQRSYGQTLNFDLKQSAIDFQGNTVDDVILTDGMTTLTFNTSYNPKITWTHYLVKLNEVSGWKKGVSNATKEDFLHVLQNLTDLRIRGEFRAGPDQGGLDNVAIY